MNELIATIEKSLAEAMAVRPEVGGFPYLAEGMRRAGVRHYLFEVPSSSVIYATDQGDVFQPGTRMRDVTAVAAYNEVALVSAIRADQRGETTFPEFVEATLAAGVIRYIVDTTERTCTYFGVRGEMYVEEYPAVQLP